MSNLIKENTIFEEVEKRCKSFISDNPLLDAYRRKETDEYFHRDTLNREREIGFNEGMRKRDILIAKGMKSKGMNFELISELTGLTIEEIEEIEKL